MFGLIWHHGRAGARTRAAESARLHGRAVGRFPSARTEQNPRERPPCYYPRRRGSSKSRGRTARCAVEIPAAPTPTQRDWRVIKINYSPNEGTQTPADCALTAPPVRRINWAAVTASIKGNWTRVQAQRAGGLGSYGPAARAVDSRQEDRNGGSMTIQRRNDDDSAGCRRADPTTRSVV